MLWPPRLLADRAEEVLLNPAPPKALLLEPKPEPEDTLRLPMLFRPLPKPDVVPVLGRAPLGPPPGRLLAAAPAPSPVPLPGRLAALAPPERLPAPIFPAAPPPGGLPAPPATAAPPARPAAPPGRLAPPAGRCRARPPYLLAVFRSPQGAPPRCCALCCHFPPCWPRLILLMLFRLKLLLLLMVMSRWPQLQLPQLFAHAAPNMSPVPNASPIPGT